MRSLHFVGALALVSGANVGENTGGFSCPGGGNHVCGNDSPQALVDACGTMLKQEPTGGPKTIFATFNGGPGPTGGVQCGTENLLDVLSETGVRGSFFLSAASLNPAIQCAAGDVSCVRPALKNLFKMVRAGHFVGTLGYGSHTLEQGVTAPDAACSFVDACKNKQDVTWGASVLRQEIACNGTSVCATDTGIHRIGLDKLTGYAAIETAATAADVFVRLPGVNAWRMPGRHSTDDITVDHGDTTTGAMSLCKSVSTCAGRPYVPSDCGSYSAPRLQVAVAREDRDPAGGATQGTFHEDFSCLPQICTGDCKDKSDTKKCTCNPPHADAKGQPWPVYFTETAKEGQAEFSYPWDQKTLDTSVITGDPARRFRIAQRVADMLYGYNCSYADGSANTKLGCADGNSFNGNGLQGYSFSCAWDPNSKCLYPDEANLITDLESCAWLKQNKNTPPFPPGRRGILDGLYERVVFGHDESARWVGNATLVQLQSMLNGTRLGSPAQGSSGLYAKTYKDIINEVALWPACEQQEGSGEGGDGSCTPYSIGSEQNPGLLARLFRGTADGGRDIDPTEANIFKKDPKTWSICRMVANVENDPNPLRKVVLSTFDAYLNGTGDGSSAGQGGVASNQGGQCMLRSLITLLKHRGHTFDTAQNYDKSVAFAPRYPKGNWTFVLLVSLVCLAYLLRLLWYAFFWLRSCMHTKADEDAAAEAARAAEDEEADADRNKCVWLRSSNVAKYVMGSSVSGIGPRQDITGVVAYVEADVRGAAQGPGVVGVMPGEEGGGGGGAAAKKAAGAVLPAALGGDQTVAMTLDMAKASTKKFLPGGNAAAYDSDADAMRVQQNLLVGFNELKAGMKELSQRTPLLEIARDAYMRGGGKLKAECTSGVDAKTRLLRLAGERALKFAGQLDTLASRKQGSSRNDAVRLANPLFRGKHVFLLDDDIDNAGSLRYYTTPQAVEQQGAYDQTVARHGQGGAGGPGGQGGAGRSTTLKTSNTAKYSVGQPFANASLAGVVARIETDNGSVPPHHSGAGRLTIQEPAAPQQVGTPGGTSMQPEPTPVDSKLRTSNVGKYRVGQQVSGMGPSQLTGTIVQLVPDNGSAPPMGPGHIVIRGVPAATGMGAIGGAGAAVPMGGITKKFFPGASPSGNAGGTAVDYAPQQVGVLWPAMARAGVDADFQSRSWQTISRALSAQVAATDELLQLLQSDLRLLDPASGQLGGVGGGAAAAAAAAAAASGRRQLTSDRVQSLLQRGADGGVTDTQGDGSTLLHLATRSSDPHLLAMLLGSGPAGAGCLRAVDVKGRLPMEYAWYGAARALRKLGVRGFENINECWRRFDEKAHAVLADASLAQRSVEVLCFRMLFRAMGNSANAAALAFGESGGADCAALEQTLRFGLYTAVTSPDPRNMARDSFLLRQVRDHGGLDGIMSTHLMVVLTMYNEDAGELRGTLCALQRAFEYLFSREERRVNALSAEVRRAMKEGLDAGGAVEDNGSVSPAEGRRRWCNAVATGQAWRQVVVCIVSDGKTKIHPSAQEYLGKLGLFDRSAMHLCSLGLEPSLHLFEKTVRPKFLRLEEGDVAACPMQGILALKEHNAGKLDSHRWAFNGLAPQLKPRYLMTLDVGTMPTPEAVYRLLRAMERNPQIGGVCGEIAVDKPLTSASLTNIVVAAQNWEYKVSNVMDKAMESVFGFVTVLPGAFSAYRYEALRGAPLQAYLRPCDADVNARSLGAFKGNMHLAEDRVLCFELLARKGCKWTMHYVKGAVAFTDVPETLVAFIKQRRRWLNGANFAMLHSLLNFHRFFFDTAHSWARKLAIFVQMLYMWVGVLITVLSPCLYFLTFHFLVVEWLQSNIDAVVPGHLIWLHDLLPGLVFGLEVLFLLVCVLLFVVSLGNKPDHVASVFEGAAFFFGFIHSITGVVVAQLMIDVPCSMPAAFYGEPARSTCQAEYGAWGAPSAGIPTILWLVSVLGILFLVAALHREVHHLLLTAVQAFMLIPSNIMILGIFSFCNLHDLSWGTKGNDTAQEHGGGGEGGDGELGEFEEDNGSTSIAGPDKGEVAASRLGYEFVVAEEARLKKAQKEAAADASAQEREFQIFRSQFLLSYLVANIVGAAAILHLVPFTDYMLFVVGLASAVNVFRAVFSVIFLLTRFLRSRYLPGLGWLFSWFYTTGDPRAERQRRGRGDDLIPLITME